MSTSEKDISYNYSWNYCRVILWWRQNTNITADYFLRSIGKSVY